MYGELHTCGKLVYDTRTTCEFSGATCVEEAMRATYTGARDIGHVIQRGPPRPRPSSVPGTVITSIPFSRKCALIVTLRSYATTTPGAIAKTLSPSSHCSRAAA